MRTLEIGLVLPMGDSFVDGTTVRWTEIRDLAIRAESIGFDTVWTADELLWRSSGGIAQGWWECVAMTGAVAAATSRVKVGTWVLSALHRNPAITGKAVETLDEISGGRFVLGLGSGHAGRQAHAFGLPEDHLVETWPSTRGSHEERGRAASATPSGYGAVRWDRDRTGTAREPLGRLPRR
jgi:alkanesulfonate monooxygenase SsuD/methylene tetrahydromethanopterin reductase-like flavin-dependent oxidoreductase (luciferase family)